MKLETMTLEDVDGFVDLLIESCPGDEIRLEFKDDGEIAVVEGRISNAFSEGDTDCRKYALWIDRENAPNWSVTYWPHPIEHYAKIRYGEGDRVADMDKAMVNTFENIELTKTDRGLRTA